MTSWDLLNEMNNLRRELDETFQEYGLSRPQGTPFLSARSSRGFPLVNFSEDEGHLYVELLVPGVDPKETELSLLRNTITISGERKPVTQLKGEIIHREELGAGRFSRTLELPMDIDPARVSAVCKDGIMQITLAKAEHAKPKRIEVKPS